MNQKANSIADMAAVLLLQEQGPMEERILNAERRRQRVETLKRIKGKDKVKKNPIDVLSEMGGVQGVMVKWADMLDAEYAETWPEAVVHDDLEKSGYTAAFPVMEEVGSEEDLDESARNFVETEQRGEDTPPLVSALPLDAQRAAIATA